MLNGPEGDVLLQLVVAHGIQRPDLFDGGRPHLLEFGNQVRINPPGGELAQNILPFAELLHLPLQVLHQRIAADGLLLCNFIEKAVGLVETVGTGFHRVLILVIQRLNIPFQLLIDRANLVGILLLQLDALLVGGLLNALDVGDILLLGLIDLLLQLIDLQVHLLALFAARRIPALNTLIGGQLVRQAHSAVVLLLLDPVHRILIGLVHKLVAKGVDLPVDLLAFLAALHIPGLHPLIGGQFLLGAQPVVVFLLLDPVEGSLIGGRHQFILKLIDLPVDLLPLLGTGFVLLLKVFPSGQLVFQTQLVVIGLLIHPVLPGVDAFVADGDNLADHVGSGLGGRDDAVVDADGQALTDVLAQINELPGGRMAVQGLFRRVQRGKAQTAAR